MSKGETPRRDVDDSSGSKPPNVPPEGGPGEPLCSGVEHPPPILSK